MLFSAGAGNQSPDPLIDFFVVGPACTPGWESVTRPLDRLRQLSGLVSGRLGISHQTP